MTESFAAGALAGLAIAMPPGAIATLILATGLRRGFTFAAVAGLGAASVDFVYALVALLVGNSIAALLTGAERPLQLATGSLLIGFGIWGASRARRCGPEPDASAVTTRDLLSTYGRFAALTAANPATLGYFAAVAVGLGANAVSNVPAFASGVATASAAWQLLLATLSGALHGRLTEAARGWSVLGGNLIVVLLGIAVLVRALA